MRQVINSPYRNQISDPARDLAEVNEQSNQDNKVQIASARRLASHCQSDLAGLGLPTSFLHAQSRRQRKN